MDGPWRWNGNCQSVLITLVAWLLCIVFGLCCGLVSSLHQRHAACGSQEACRRLNMALFRQVRPIVGESGVPASPLVNKHILDIV